MLQRLLNFLHGIIQTIKRKLIRIKNRAITNYLGKAVKKLTLPGQIMEIGLMDEPFRPGGKVKYYKTAPETLAGWFSFTEDDREFLIFPGKPTDPETQRLTFRQTHAAADAFREIFVTKYNVKKGDRVGIIMSNVPEFCIALMAIVEAGAIAVAINAWWEGRELEFGLTDSGCSVLVADERRLMRLVPEGRLEGLMRTRGLRVVVVRPSPSLLQAVPGVGDFHALLAAIRPDAITTPRVLPGLKADDDALIIYTSGTTSARAKGVVLTHRNLVQSLMSFQLFLELMKVLVPKNTPRRADLLCAPLFHTAGLLSTFLMAFKDGHKVVFMPKWDPDMALRLCLQEDITYFGAMPTMLSDILKSSVFLENLDKFKFSNIGTGGAAVPSELIHKTARALPRISQGSGWGLTESCSIGTVIGGPEYLEVPNSCGKAHALVDIKLVNPETGEDVPPGTDTGELCLRSVTNMRCYWNLPEETARTFTRDGYLRTGDLGRIDPVDGFIFIVDRVKNLVIRGGENISCAEVEDVTFSFPGEVISEVCCFGLPHERLGEVLACAVVLMPGKSCDERAVKEHIANRLAKFKVPEVVFIRDPTQPLPRGATGKILKRMLQEEYKGRMTTGTSVSVA